MLLNALHAHRGFHKCTGTHIQLPDMSTMHYIAIGYNPFQGQPVPYVQLLYRLVQSINLSCRIHDQVIIHC